MLFPCAHGSREYLMVLSEVSSTRWGSSVSLGYQAAWRKVTEVKLVKKRSATGIVLRRKKIIRNRLETMVRVQVRVRVQVPPISHSLEPFIFTAVTLVNIIRRGAPLLNSLAIDLEASTFEFGLLAPSLG